MGIGERFYFEQEIAAKTDYLELLWRTEKQGYVKVRDMNRLPVQASLNWCICKGAEPDNEKDGIKYSMWIAYFTRRLFDPNLE